MGNAEVKGSQGMRVLGLGVDQPEDLGLSACPVDLKLLEAPGLRVAQSGDADLMRPQREQN